MKKYIFILIFLSTFFLNAQIPFQGNSYLNLRVHYISGDQTNRENYKWLNPDTGKDAFLYSSDIQVLNCDCPDDLSKGIEIFKSFTLLGKWFNLMGEFASNPGLMYEYKDDFSFIKNGVKYNINKKLLSKYPALLKRLKYASPTFFDYILRFDAITKDGSVSGIELIVKDVDLLIPPESEMPYMVAGAPSKWNERIVIGNYINDNEIENKKRWASLVEIKNNVSLVINKISIPVDELITIANLYKEYEKEDKILKDKYKIIEPEYKPAKATLPYNKTDNWSKPYEPEIKTAEPFNIGEKVGLRSGSKIVFESDEHLRGRPLSKSLRFFEFFNKKTRSNEVIDAKGRKITIGARSTFLSIENESNGNNLVFVTAIDKNKSSSYKTLVKYSSRDLYYNASAFEQMKIRDKRYYNESLEPTQSNGKSTVTIGFAEYFWFFYEVDIITTDENLRVIDIQKGYAPISETR